MRHAIPSGRSKLASIAISACLMIPAAVGAQASSPLARIQALGLDSTTFGSVPTWFAPADRAAAERLANLLGRASAFFQRELGARVEFRLAALGPAKWIPYFPGAADTIAWAAEAEALIVAPAWAVRPPPPGFHRDGEFIALHELGHLAANQYFNGGRPLDYGEHHWFGEVMATSFAYAFVRSANPAWADSARSDFPETLESYTPRVRSLDWSFMRDLPPDELGKTYGWYQIAINLQVADVLDRHGLEFLRQVKQRLPWNAMQSWTTAMLAARLEEIAPGFQAWVDRMNGRRVPDHDP